MSDTPLYGTVETVARLTPHMLRVTFGGSGLDGFATEGWTDAYLCPLFLRPGTDYAPPFDHDEKRTLPKPERPVPRRYTVRRWDAAERLLTVDFVVHGDSGVAGPWAAGAQPGDRLQFRGSPNGGYRPGADADWHLMVGDESALPAIGAALEALGAGARAIVVAVVDGPRDELAFDCRADLEIAWLHRTDPADADVLARAVEALELPAGRVHGFVHGEAGETRAVRRHLLADRGIPEEALSCSPYWRRRFTDEAWREVKKDWLREQASDVTQPSATSG